MQKIDKEAYQQRLDKITAIYADMMVHADDQATYRCPYRNRLDECTAQFGCRNQRKARTEDGPLICGEDGNLDYRSAWETKVADKEASKAGGPLEYGSGRMTHEGETCGLTVGKTIFDYADDLAVQVPTSCERTGSCHECIVEITQGMDALSTKTEVESFLRENYRLACQAIVEDADTAIAFTPLRRTPKILTVTQEKTVALAPMVTREGEVVYYNGEPIDTYRGHIYGLAIDLGTTTVVMDLVDLETGKSVHISSFENPQRFGGSDVMNRISYDGVHQGELRKAVVHALNHEIMMLAKQKGFVRQEIYEVVVAGNSTMRDIFFKLDVQDIGQKPYKSITEHEYLAGKRTSTSILMNTRRIGIRVNPKAKVYGLPLIASHVGGDVAADLMAIDMVSQPGITMLVDVGTNTEVVVAGDGQIVTASCPAGPAFEGGGIKYGMPGYEGAIESIRWNGGDITYTTIGDKTPQGLCGSGLIDLLAELRRYDQMKPKGMFADRKKYEMMVVPEQGITLSREDASNLAQAKAANYCGQYIVMRTLGINPADVDTLYLAGGFANYVNVTNAIDIGFLAPVPEDRIVKVGNAAVQGAREVLLSRSKREEVEQLVKRIKHIELETTPDFFEIFVEACQFKPMPKTLV
jgi:uncharacterized 2Fe-2S/4Fe-4S cluster protein (DUF4445 family)